MRQWLTFGGIDSRTYGVYISGSGTFNAPSRNYQTYAVPGRSGDLVLDGGRWSNGTLAYPAFIAGRLFRDNIQSFRNALAALTGYQRLTDSYHPDEFRRALYQNGLKVEPTTLFDAGQFDIEFNVDPRRFLLSGETVTELTATGSIINPTLFASRPLLRVYGTGTVKIGSDTITISRNASYTDIDCDLRECYRGTANLNANVSLSGLDFPELAPGADQIVLSGVTKVEITPRWFRL